MKYIAPLKPLIFFGLVIFTAVAVTFAVYALTDIPYWVKP